MNFKLWLSLTESTHQLSRKHVVEMLRWVQHLAINLGYLSSGSEDSSKYQGDYARLRRIAKQGVAWAGEAMDLVGAGQRNAIQVSKEIADGLHDKSLVQFAAKVIRMTKSLRYNFDEIKFDTSQIASFEGLEKLVAQLPPISWQAA